MDEPSIERGALAVLGRLIAWIARWIVLLAMILVLLATGLVLALSMRNDRVAVRGRKPQFVPRISG